MSDKTFVDSSGWYALIDRRDPAHGKAVSMVRGIITGGSRLVTTDYVIDELCTLTFARSGPSAALRLLDLLDQTKAVDWEWIGSDRFAAAKRYFQKRVDQGYSFTDCTSFVLMRELRMTDACRSADGRS